MLRLWPAFASSILSFFSVIENARATANHWHASTTVRTLSSRSYNKSAGGLVYLLGTLLPARRGLTRLDFTFLTFMVFIDFDHQVGHEQAKRRPALVLTGQRYNRASGLAVGLLRGTKRTIGHEQNTSRMPPFGAF